MSHARPHSKKDKRQRPLHLEQLEDRALMAVAAVSLRVDGKDTGNVGATFSDQSANGRYVVFRSLATNLVKGVHYTQGSVNIFRRDRVTGKTEIVSVAANDNKRAANGPSFNAYISASGRFVAFESDGNNLAKNDTNHIGHDIFVRDMVKKKTYLINRNLQGKTTVGAQNLIRESDQTDGRFITDNGFIVFQSDASNLVKGDNNHSRDVFVRDFIHGKTYLANTNNSGKAGNGPSDHGVLSANGRYVAFESRAMNIVANDHNFNTKIYRRDLVTKKTVLVSNHDLQNGSLESGGSFLPKMSADGNVIVFESFRRLSSNDADNANRDVYVRNMKRSIPELVSISATGGPANSTSFDPNISDNGRFVVFESLASNLTNTDKDPSTQQALTNLDNKDVFWRDLAKKKTVLVSFNFKNSRDATGESRNIDISANGRFVAWESQSRDLVKGFHERNDSTFAFDIFRRDMSQRKTTLVSAKFGSTKDSGNGGSFFPVVSADGRYVSFHSTATDLIKRDTNSGNGGMQTDVFVSPAKYVKGQAAAQDEALLQVLNLGNEEDDALTAFTDDDAAPLWSL